MKKEDVMQFLNLSDEFRQTMDNIVYIAWGVHLDSFLTFTPDSEWISCYWQYDSDQGIDVDIVPTYLLHSSNEEIAEYFIQGAKKRQEHDVEIAKRTIKLYTEKVEDCDKIITTLKKLQDSIQTDNGDINSALEAQNLTKVQYEMTITENQYTIDNSEMFTNDYIKNVTERYNSITSNNH